MNILGMILPTIQGLIELAAKIAFIVIDRGVSGAGEVRLKDIPGWKAWSTKMLKEEASLKTLVKLAKLRDEQ